MTTDASLPIVPLPAADEHVCGYVRRVVDMNLLDRVRAVLADHEITFLSPRSDDATWGSLRAMTGLGTVERMRWPLSEDPSRAFVGEHPIAMVYLRSVRMPLCPRCIERDQIVRRAWSLVGVTACTEHRVQLRDQCECGRPILYATPGGAWMCGDCGVEHGELRAEPASAAELSISCALTRSLDDDPRSDEEAELAAAFHDFEADDLAWTVEHLGRLAMLRDEDQPVAASRLPKTAGVADPTTALVECRRVAEHAYPIMRDWPDAYHDLLVDLVDRNVAPTADHPLLRRFSTKAGVHALRALVHQAIGASDPVQAELRAFLADRLGYRSGQRVPARAAAAKEALATAQPTDLISAAHAMSLLEGRSAKPVDPWIEAGLLTPVEMPRGAKGFSRAAVMEALERVARHALPAPEGEKLDTFNQVVMLDMTNHFTKADLLRDLAAGNLTCYAAGPVTQVNDILISFWDSVHRRAAANIGRQIEAGAYMRLVDFNKPALKLWGAWGRYNGRECDQMVAGGRLRFGYQRAVARTKRPNKQPDKIYHVGDLVRATQSWLGPQYFDVDALERRGEQLRGEPSTQLKRLTLTGPQDDQRWA